MILKQGQARDRKIIPGHVQFEGGHKELHICGNWDIICSEISIRRQGTEESEGYSVVGIIKVPECQFKLFKK